MKAPHLAVLVAALAPLALAQERFAGQQLASTWARQSLPAAGDFDGDGRPDLVSVVSEGGDVVLRLQRGDGSGWVLDAADTALASDSLGVPAVMDADQDGDLDAIVYAPGHVVVQHGDGAGHFRAGGSFLFVTAAAGPMADADLDGDGATDLVAGHTSASIVSILMADGAGGFGPASPNSSSSFLKHFALGDINGDAVPDLVMPNQISNKLNVAAGDGRGGFGALFPIDAGLKTATVAVGDLDGNGLNDIVSGRDPADPMLSVLLANGTGFTAPNVFAVSFKPSDLDLADMDHDGVPDIVAAFFSTGVQVLRTTSGGTAFTVIEQEPLELAPVNTFPSARVLDFDGDGEQDLLASATVATLFHGTGGGQFADPPALPAPGQARALLLADLTEDGILDALGAGSVNSPGLPGFVTLFAGDGLGGLGPGLELPASPGACSLATADFDGDGRPEIVVANDATHDLSLLRDDGSGWTSTQPGGWPWFAWNQAPLSVDTGDFDGDGLADILATRALPHTVSLLLASAPGSFAAPVESPIGGLAGPRQALGGDFDDDGDLDVVYAGGASEVGLMLNHGAGAFAVASVVSAAIVSDDALATGDLDLDGHLDVVTGRFEVLLGDGRGTLASVAGPTPQLVSSISTTDLDGDGLLDVLGATGGRMSVTRGDGAGGFSGWIGVLASGGVGACAAGDLDGDLRPDLVAFGSASTIHLQHAPQFTWSQLGGALAGSDGTPLLTGHGTLAPGSELELVVDRAKPGAPAALIAGLSALGAPFKGGLLWPHPDLLVTGPPLDADGYLSLAATWPATLPSRPAALAAGWIPDPSGTQGWSSTNGLLATTP